jgi:hypothetical protein
MYGPTNNWDEEPLAVTLLGVRLYLGQTPTRTSDSRDRFLIMKPPIQNHLRAQSIRKWLN